MKRLLFSSLLPFGSNNSDRTAPEQRILNVYFSLIGARQYEATVDGSAICERCRKEGRTGVAYRERVERVLSLHWRGIQMMIV